MKSISKSCRLIKMIVFCVMIFSLAMTSIDVFAAYSSDWKSWTQSGSSNSNVKQYGCRVVAFAKIIYESGWADFSNPDEYFNIGVQNGWFQSGVTENGSFGNALSSYISSRGGTCSKIREISLNQNATSYSNDIMDYVRSGYYITLSCSSHTAYISPSASVAAGKPVVYDSGKSTSTSLIHDLSNKANTGDYWTKLRVWQIPTQAPTDTTGPTISNICVSNIDNTGYTVSCTVTDSSGVNRVQFPSWTWYYDQDDIQTDWTTNPIASGTTADSVNYTYRVNVSDHNNEGGWYFTAIYAYDIYGNQSSATAENDGKVYVDVVAPTISNVQITNKSNTGYTVSCTVTDDYSGVNFVQFPSWTDYKGQDDCKWENHSASLSNTYSYEVKTSDHNGEVLGYNTRIIAYDLHGNKATFDNVVGSLIGEKVDLGTDFVAVIKNAATNTCMTNVDNNVVGWEDKGTANQNGNLLDVMMEHIK